MESEREEVYERIPWETLERRGGDRQWMVYAVAGAVTLGALAYSFTRSQPTAPMSPEAPVATTLPAASAEPTIVGPPSTVASPLVVAEADLYAVDPERLLDQVSSHAEWFAVEYISVDGSDASRELLSSLLPMGIPVPAAPETTQVFVDWASVMEVSETGPLSYAVEVLVRSLMSDGETGFVRQQPRLVVVSVEIAADGQARVTGAPSIAMATTTDQAAITLAPVPDEVAAQATEAGEVLGGIQLPDGSWEVVVMAVGPDGVRRPMAVRP
jgi:hypothetical protein